jgi:hypothetical protein
VERAEVVLNRTEKKVERSVGREHVVKERRKDWEVINGSFGVGKGKQKAGKQGKGQWEEMDEVEMENEVATGDVGGNGEGVKVEKALETGPKLVVVDRTATTEPEDEIT